MDFKRFKELKTLNLKKQEDGADGNGDDEEKQREDFDISFTSSQADRIEFYFIE